MDDFLPAAKLNRKQRRISDAVSKGRISKQPSITESGLNSGLTVSDVSEPDLRRRLGAAVSHFRKDAYFSSVSKVLDKALTESGITVDLIVCYGLGSFGNSLLSRYQLAFLILLKEKLDCSVEIFDPVFSTNEINVMGTCLGFKVLVKDEEAQRLVDGGTESGILFFMPHAPHGLVNNLLCTNWVPTSISKCICICNSFMHLRTTFPKEAFRHNLGYIDRSEKIVVEYEIINTFHHKSVFNDTSIHSFPRQRLEELHLPREYWERSLKAS